MTKKDSKRPLYIVKITRNYVTHTSQNPNYNDPLRADIKDYPKDPIEEFKRRYVNNDFKFYDARTFNIVEIKDFDEFYNNLYHKKRKSQLISNYLGKDEKKNR